MPELEVFLFYFPPEMSLIGGTTGGLYSKHHSLKAVCVCVCVLVWIFSLCNIQCEGKQAPAQLFAEALVILSEYSQMHDKCFDHWSLFLVRLQSSALHELQS